MTGNGAESWVATVLRVGYHNPLQDSPPSFTPVPLCFRTCSPGSWKSLILAQLVFEMLEEGDREIVADPGFRLQPLFPCGRGGC